MTPPAQTDAGTEFPTDTNAMPSDTSASENPNPAVTEPPLADIPEPPSSIEVQRKPTALPQGIYEDVVVNSKTGLLIEYYQNDEFLFAYQQDLMDVERTYDNTEVMLTEIRVNGYSGILIEYREEPLIIIEWTDAEYRYQILSEVYGKEELLAIAESVK